MNFNWKMCSLLLWFYLQWNWEWSLRLSLNTCKRKKHSHWISHSSSPNKPIFTLIKHTSFICSCVLPRAQPQNATPQCRFDPIQYGFRWVTSTSQPLSDWAALASGACWTSSPPPSSASSSSSSSSSSPPWGTRSPPPAARRCSSPPPIRFSASACRRPSRPGSRAWSMPAPPTPPTTCRVRIPGWTASWAGWWITTVRDTARRWRTRRSASSRRPAGTGCRCSGRRACTRYVQCSLSWESDAKVVNGV